MKTKRVLALTLAAWMSCCSMAVHAIGEGAAPTVPVIGGDAQIGSGAAPSVPTIGNGASPTVPTIGTGAYPVPVIGGGRSGNIVAGGFYERDGSDIASLVRNDELLPGTTYYIGLGAQSPDRSSATAYWDVSERQSDGHNVRLVNSRLQIVQRRASDGQRYYFVEFPIKTLSASEYDPQGYYLKGYLDLGDTYGAIGIDAEVQYAGGNYEITTKPQYFTFSSGDEISLPYENSYIKVLFGSDDGSAMAMNTHFNDSIANAHPHADLVFLNGNGGSFGNNAEVHIDANGWRYFYQNVNGKLTDMSSTYNRSEDMFVFRTRSLGSYVISDTDLRERGTHSSAGTTTNSHPSAKQLGDWVAENYSNQFVVVTYGTKLAQLSKTAEYKVKIDLSHLNTRSLRVYVYDSARGKLLLMPNARPVYSSSKSQLTFDSDYKGQFIVTDHALTKR